MVHAWPLLPKAPPTHCDKEGGAGRASLQVDHGQQGWQLPLTCPRVEQPAGGDSDIMLGGASGGGASQGVGPGEGAGKRKWVDFPQGGSKEREGGKGAGLKGWGGVLGGQGLVGGRGKGKWLTPPKGGLRETEKGRALGRGWSFKKGESLQEAGLQG